MCIFFLGAVSNKEVPVDFLQDIFIKFVAEIRVRSLFVVAEKLHSLEKTVIGFHQS